MYFGDLDLNPQASLSHLTQSHLGDFSVVIFI